VITPRFVRPRPTASILAAAAVLALAWTPVTAEPAPDGGAAQEEARELELLRSMARQTRSAVRTEDLVVDVGSHPALGEPGSVLTLIEFSDLQCGFCRRHLNSVLPVLLERHVASGQLRYVFFDFPVTERHPEAFHAAIGARCAAEQNALQPMRERYFANPEQLQPQHLNDHAAALGLDAEAFSACLADEEKAEAVRRDLALGHQLQVRGTPTFLVGYREGGGTEVRVVRRIVGAQPLDVFESAINGALAQAQGSMAALR
jgi:protein-disulfide isomerase